jgi:hypothetical protein
MKWLLANTNLRWCGFYLPSPSHRDDSWMQADDADLEGWGFAPIYVGQQTTGPGSHNVTTDQGAIDGADACAQMTAGGWTAGSKVYLDQEQGGPEPAAMRAYTSAWAQAVVASGFQPCVYTSFQEAAQVHADLPGVGIWVYHVRTTAQHDVAGVTFLAPDPSTSGYPGALIWQHDDEAAIPCAAAPNGKLVVDLNSADSADPSV